MKKSSLLKKILLTLLVLLALSASTLYYLFIMQPFQEMRALNHRTLSQEEFLQYTDPNSEDNRIKTDPKKIVAQIEVNFIFPTLDEESTLIAIDSSKMLGNVYFGPYKKQITIKADEELFSHGGGDDIQVRFYNKKTLDSYVGFAESVQMWVPGKKVFIELLPYREIDPRTGVPTTFKVYLK